jgi:hypothetical protein
MQDLGSGIGASTCGGGNWAATSGNVNDEVWKRYIEEKSQRSGEQHYSGESILNAVIYEIFED